MYAPSKITCTMIAAIVRQASHDRFTRLLSSALWEGQALLNCTARKLFGELHGGYLIVDDTVITKLFAKVIDCIFWVWSSKAEKTVLGISIVVLCWSNGIITIPLSFRIWNKGSKSKCDLALELLLFAKKTLKLRPKYVLFDSYYAAKKIIKQIEQWGWKYATSIKKNRLFNGQQLSSYRKQPYWIEQGKVLDCKITIVRHGKKYFATNDHSLTSAEVRSLYKLRWKIEEVFRFLHGKLGLDDCQARSTVTQRNHITLCFLAATLIERERQARNMTRYQLKRILSLKREDYHFLVIRPFFEGA